MSEEQARGIRERRLGYNDGLKAGDKWTDGDAEPQPDLAKSDDYRSGFKLGFDEKAEYKRPLRDLLVGTIPSDVDFAAMKGNFDKYNEFGEKQPLDETPLDLSLYDEEGEGEPSPKRRKRGGGGKSKKRRKSKKSKKAKRSRKQKK